MRVPVLTVLAAAAVATSACQSITPQSDSHPQTTPSSSATPRPSPIARPSPTPAGLSGLAVVEVDGLNLREGPGTDQPIQTIGPGGPNSGEPLRLSANELVWVIDAREVGAEIWYHVVALGIPGWVSGGPETDPWITPFDPAACPSSPIAAFPELDPQPMRSLVCYGGDELTLVVYWPTPEETGVDVPCPWSEPRWLLCYEYVNLTEDGARSLAVYGTTELPAFQRGAWVTLVGHFDDPRSEGCPDALGQPPDDAGDVAVSVLFCRTRFVAEAVGPPPVP